METKAAVGFLLTQSGPIINTAANTIGVAKTGTAIGTLHGIAHTNATAAWIGLGSMKVGSLVMGALPIIGTLLILDSLSAGADDGVPIIDWHEQWWLEYEAQCELEEMKKTFKPQKNKPVGASQPPTRLYTSDQLEAIFLNLEIEDQLCQMKKDLGLV